MSKRSAQMLGLVIVLFVVLGVLAGLNIFEAVGVAVISLVLWVGLAWALSGLSERRPFSYLFLSEAEYERQKRDKESD